jgi:hypothetical protein
LGIATFSAATGWPLLGLALSAGGEVDEPGNASLFGLSDPAPDRVVTAAEALLLHVGLGVVVALAAALLAAYVLSPGERFFASFVTDDGPRLTPDPIFAEPGENAVMLTG